VAAAVDANGDATPNPPLAFVTTLGSAIGITGDACSGGVGRSGRWGGVAGDNDEAEFGSSAATAAFERMAATANPIAVR